MKRIYRGLSLEIRELKEKYVIIVEDNTDRPSGKTYKNRYEAPKDDNEAKIEMLNDAKEWLWNMGSFNGEANVMMNKNHYDWIKELKLKVSYDEYFSAKLGRVI